MSSVGSEMSPLAGRMVFLVGARRSGTNWLHRILGAHPAVALVPSETYLFSHGIAPLVDRFHHGPSGSPRTGFLHMERDDLLAACRDFCDRALSPYLHRAEGATLLVERTPWHVEHLELIGSVYPDARIVHIIRDGRDVARSLDAQEWGHTESEDLAEAAAEWRRAVLAARRVAPGLQDYRELRYEELFADPRGSARDLYGWLGLTVDDGILDAALAEAGARFNVDQSLSKVTTEKWRLALSADEVARIESVAGDALAELGYTTAEADEDTPVAEATRPGGEGSVSGHGAGVPARRRRRRLGRARALAGRLRRRGGAPVSDASPSMVTMESTAQVVDELLDALHTGDLDGIVQRTAPDVRVRIVDRGAEWTGRGELGRRRLLDVAHAHGLVGARQRRGDVHPGVASFSVVFTYDIAADASLDAVFVIHVERARARYVTYYRLPLH